MQKLNVRVAVFWNEETGWTTRIVQPDAAHNCGGYGDMAGQAIVTLTVPDAAPLPFE